MNIGKISRSLIVAIFVIIMLYLSYINISLVISSSDALVSKHLIIKLIYTISIAALLLTYIYIKSKFYKQKLNRKLALTYRYIFMFIIIIASSFLVLGDLYYSLTKFELVLSILFKIIISMLLKQIIFNISKSDILSVLAVILFSMFPNVVMDKGIFFNSLAIVLCVSSTILFMQYLIDELKQHGIKNYKYLRYSIFIGVFSGISVVLGINIYVFLFSFLMLMLISYNLDTTHINFPSKILNNTSFRKREFLYKIERINLSKLLISILIATLIMIFVVFILQVTILNGLSGFISCLNLKALINANSFKYILNNINNLLNTSNIYYMLMMGYIVFIELLNFILRRKYDTKSTAIKSIYILIILVYVLSGIDLFKSQLLFTTLLIIVSIINTSNIYLNREERIKLLN